MNSPALLNLENARAYRYYCNRRPELEAHLALKRHQHIMNWSKRHNVLDIGCGPGDITYNRLLPLLPRDAELVGGDLSPGMIQLANLNFQDPRLKFEIMDVTGSEIVEKYEGTFDAVFSSYLLHWVQDQRSAIRNIYNILQNGGAALLLVLARHPIFPLTEIMAHNKKWAPYMHDFKTAVSPYYHSPEPEKDMRSLLSDVGFVVKDCYCMSNSSGLPAETFFDTLKAVDPFSARIPHNLIDEYNEDRETVVRNENLASFSKETGEMVTSYTLIIACAEKPIMN